MTGLAMPTMTTSMPTTTIGEIIDTHDCGCLLIDLPGLECVRVPAPVHGLDLDDGPDLVGRLVEVDLCFEGRCRRVVEVRLVDGS